MMDYVIHTSPVWCRAYCLGLRIDYCDPVPSLLNILSILSQSKQTPNTPYISFETPKEIAIFLCIIVDEVIVLTKI